MKTPHHRHHHHQQQNNNSNSHRNIHIVRHALIYQSVSWTWTLLALVTSSSIFIFPEAIKAVQVSGQQLTALTVTFETILWRHGRVRDVHLQRW